MYDAALHAARYAAARSNILDRLSLEPREYQVATVHRAENTRPRDTVACCRGRVASLVRSAAAVFTDSRGSQKKLIFTGCPASAKTGDRMGRDRREIEDYGRGDAASRFPLPDRRLGLEIDANRLELTQN